MGREAVNHNDFHPVFVLHQESVSPSEEIDLSFLLVPYQLVAFDWLWLGYEMPFSSALASDAIILFYVH